MMEVWGYGPFDNDDAVEFIDKIYNKISRYVVKTITAPNRSNEVVMAAAKFIDKIGFKNFLEFDGEVLIELQTQLKIVRSDEAWMKQWNDKGKYAKRFIRRMLKDLKETLSLPAATVG